MIMELSSCREEHACSEVVRLVWCVSCTRQRVCEVVSSLFISAPVPIPFHISDASDSLPNAGYECLEKKKINKTN